jgi:hypothetical protein
MTTEKNGNQLTRWIGTLITMTVIIAGSCVAWGSLQSRMSTAEKEIEKARTSLTEQEKLIGELKGDLKYIRQVVDDIRNDMRNKP